MDTAKYYTPVGSIMASGGERTFREYARSPYDYRWQQVRKQAKEPLGNYAQSDDISEESHSENNDAEAAGRTGNTDW